MIFRSFREYSKGLLLGKRLILSAVYARYMRDGRRILGGRGDFMGGGARPVSVARFKKCFQSLIARNRATVATIITRFTINAIRSLAALHFHARSAESTLESTH